MVHDTGLEFLAKRAWGNMFDESNFNNKWYGKKNIPGGELKCYADVTEWRGKIMATVKVMVYNYPTVLQHWEFDVETENWERVGE